MDPVTIAGLAGAGASLVGGLINNAWSDARTEKQYRQMNEMQDKMNAYNAPVAQMARLREAGLNPNLVYANGGAVIQSAVGNAPQPAHTTPIDTQGVLQMVQTIVGGMLEKDKIQAQKEVTEMQTKSSEKIAEGHDTTQKEVTGMQTKSSERNVDEQIKSNKDIAEARNTLEKGIADANRTENARQFNEELQQRIYEFNENHKLNELLVKSQVAKNYSDIDINNQRVLIERAQYRITARLASLKEEADFDSLQAQKISNFFERPVKYSWKAVYDFFNEDLQIPLNYQDATLFADSHNDMVGAIAVQNWSQNSYPGAVWNVIAGPIKALLGAVK